MNSIINISNPKCSNCKRYFTPTLKSSGQPFKTCDKCRIQDKETRQNNNCDSIFVSMIKESQDVSNVEEVKFVSMIKEDQYVFYVLGLKYVSTIKENQNVSNVEEVKFVSIIKEDQDVFYVVEVKYVSMKKENLNAKIVI